jgi:ABC-type Fe3+/spermidine/putrescine transport system ATPase subunit
VAVVDVFLETRLRSFMLALAFAMGDELLCVVGRSGSGKSTILRAIAGVYIPDNGSITIRDRQVFSTGLGINIPPADRYIGYVPQSHALFPHLSIAENVVYPLRKREHLDEDEVARRMEELIDLLDLDDVAGRRPEDVPPLLQQRAALGRALAGDPDVLLIDDSFALLDNDTRRAARADFVDLRNRLAIPAIFATVELEEAYEIADRVALIESGRLLQIDPPRTLLLHPANRRVAELVRSVNVLAGNVIEAVGESTTVRTAIGDLQVTTVASVGEDVDIAIRPEHVQVLVDEPAEMGGNVIRGRVSHEERHGSIVMLSIIPKHGVSDVTLQAYLSEASRKELLLGEDSLCWLYLPPRALHLMPRLPAAVT